MQSYKRNKLHLGLTLVELIVVVTIFTIITTVLVINQNRWNRKLQLNTKLYDLALYIRQAQFYSISVKEDNLSFGDTFDRSYGIHFDTDSVSSFIFFSDRNKNQKYDLGEGISTYIFQNNYTNGIFIDRICGYNIAGSVERCSPDAGNIKSLDILFSRPEAKSIIVFLNNGGNSSASVNPPAKIYLRNSYGDYASVKVYQNGQVAINKNE